MRYLDKIKGAFEHNDSRSAAVTPDYAWYRGSPLLKDGYYKYLVFLIFALVIVVTLFTHMGAKSPYSYGWSMVDPKVRVPKIEGHAVNPDAVPCIYSATDFFYEPTPQAGVICANPLVTFPLYSFLLSILIGLTRSYMLSNYVVNVAFVLLLFWAFIKLASKFDIPYKAICIAGLTILMIPFFAHYIGQPMQYTVATAINFLVVMIVLSLSNRGYKNPWGLGLLAGILMLNYDPYIFVGAILLYLIFFYRFDKWHHYVYFFLALLAPYLAWKLFLGAATVSGVPSAYSNINQFMKPMIDGWIAFFKNPIRNFTRPFTWFQIGLTIGFRQIIAYVYWFLIVFVIYFLVIFKTGGAKEDPGLEKKTGGRVLSKMVILLLLLFTAEELFTAVFYWENNTRRAVPVIFAFAFIFTYVVWKTIDRRHVRYLLIGLLIISFLLTFSDTLFKNPTIQATQYGEFIRGGPKEILPLLDRKLNRQSLPKLPLNEELQLFKIPRARFTSKNSAIFIFSQVFLLLCSLLFFYFLYRAEFVPKYSMWILLAVFTASIVFRFI